MSRTKRAIAACVMVTVVGTGLSPVAAADRYIDMQCQNNLAYRSMHEECEAWRADGVPAPGSPGSNGPGGLRRVLRSIPVVGGLF